MTTDEVSSHLTTALAARAVRSIERRPFAAVASFVLILWFVVFGLDLLTGPDISFSIFYLVPIAVVALRLGHRAGGIASVVGAITWYVADRLSGDGRFGDVVAVWNGIVRLGLFTIVSMLLVAVRDLLLEQRREARVDMLTDVLNSRGFRERAELEVQRARRTELPLSIGYFDLDHFKQLNDGHGHAAGDAALRSVANALAASVRTVDIVGRLGGDEFAIVLPGTDRRDAEIAIQRCRETLGPICVEFGLDMSIGVVTFRDAPTDLDAALRRADELMYEVKANGRGAVRYATEPSPSLTD